KAVRVRRIHMEEDAGKSVHDGSAARSLVDLNRAGTPLLEIVSEPDLRSADEVVAYLKALRDILVYLGINDGNLEEGSFRCDANVSVMRKGSAEYGARVELKNINSFRFIKQAIEYEVARQVELVESGGKVVQETRLFDPARNETRPMRSKEEAHDYRYFPEPDLQPLQLRAGLVEEVAACLPELPRQKLQRFQSQYGLPAYDAGLLTADRALADLFEAVAARAKDARKVSNWFLGELSRLLNETGEPLSGLRFGPAQFAELLGAVDAGTLSNNAAKAVFEEMFRTGKAPADIIREKGLGQVSDEGTVEAVVDQVLAAAATELEAYRAGKQQVFGFLVGQCMKAMKGKGNPQLVNAVLKRKLGA
ncbi:MAG: Asp-tRNA(Asn)/Glu-tRNA(Gln) amidotransferase subunit GatB, partial [Deltaproteobacteria bacterium]|nr:Asp-tRNA(Asn)/Glu-tRNA(Gln) amidotransferase subunit GatB [Deltaproteobacteria bacterium]